MTKRGIEELALAWVTSQAIAGTRTDQEWEPIFAVQELSNDAPDTLWDFICAVVSLSPADSILGMLAAGPLEDIIQEHGDAFLTRITVEARTNPKFAKLLPMVWLPSSNDTVTHAYIGLGCDAIRGRT